MNRVTSAAWAASMACGVFTTCGVLMACAAPRAVPEAAAPRQMPERVPGAVVWPDALPSAEAAPGLTLLRPPPPRQLARRTVQAFFDAVRRESVGELSIWLADDATISSGPGTSAESIAKVWAARFKQLDYGYSGAKQPYRSDDVGLFTAAELTELGRARRFVLKPEGDELLAVVDTRDRRHMVGPRHFGKRLEFLLGPTPDGYRIRRMFEDFRLP